MQIKAEYLTVNIGLRMKQIVFTHGGGRLANQLTNFAHLIALIEEYSPEFQLQNMAFIPYSHLFQPAQEEKKTSENFSFKPTILKGASCPSAYNEQIARIRENTKKQKKLLHPAAICCYPSDTNCTKIGKPFSLFDDSPNVIQSFLHTQALRYIHLKAFISKQQQSLVSRKNKYETKSLIAGKNINDVPFASPQFANLLKNKDYTLLAGWPLRNWKLFDKHKQKIRNWFKINEQYRTAAQVQINSIRKKTDFLIGVLIRQTDYRIWNEGKFYYDSLKYANWLGELLDLVDEKDTIFLLTSDENQDENLFQNYPVYWAEGTKHKGGHFMQSFAALSMCDLIVSPPSTFSLWAAFLGEKPILPLCNYQQKMSKSQILENNILDAINHECCKQAIK